MQKTLLIIEDEPAILRFLQSTLQTVDWHVLAASNGSLGLDLAAIHRPDAILLDLGLPGHNALGILKSLREFTGAPIIVMTVHGAVQSMSKAVEEGADDYLVKPFEVSELITRLRLALHHAEGRPGAIPPVYEHNELKVDLLARRIWFCGKQVHLSPIQYKLLTLLIRNAGRTVCNQELIEGAWGRGSSVTVDRLRVFISQIRRKIESDPAHPSALKTDTAVGYRLEGAKSVRIHRTRTHSQFLHTLNMAPLREAAVS